jgi:hypothetical protein
MKSVVAILAVIVLLCVTCSAQAQYVYYGCNAPAVVTPNVVVQAPGVVVNVPAVPVPTPYTVPVYTQGRVMYHFYTPVPARTGIVYRRHFMPGPFTYSWHWRW